MHATFGSQVFTTTSNVLNSDVNIVNIALSAFCSLAVTKLGHRCWPMSSLLSCGAVWVAGRQFATAVIVCFSFALIKLSLKRFLSFLDCFTRTDFNL